jgi:adenylosuccinate lyase
MATENILMSATAQGGDRQILHERIRQHSHVVTGELKKGAKTNDLIERLRADPAFSQVDFEHMLEPAHYVGRASQQVDEFLQQEVIPIRNRYGHLSNQTTQVHV